MFALNRYFSIQIQTVKSKHYKREYELLEIQKTQKLYL